MNFLFEFYELYNSNKKSFTKFGLIVAKISSLKVLKNSYFYWDFHVDQYQKSKCRSIKNVRFASSRGSKPKQWSDLFTKFKGGKASFTNTTPKHKIQSKNDNALICMNL